MVYVYVEYMSSDVGESMYIGGGACRKQITSPILMCLGHLTSYFTGAEEATPSNGQGLLLALHLCITPGDPCWVQGSKQIGCMQRKCLIPVLLLRAPGVLLK